MLPSKKLRSLCQASPDAVSQFGRGCLCEGHDQNLRRHQALTVPAMTQNETDIQSCQSPSFAGSCAGLNELNTLQWQGENIELLGGQRAHTGAPAMTAVAIKSA